MPANGAPAEPIAKGTWATAKQAWHDLFVWQQRTAVTEPDGNKRYEWQSPAPLQNPISLFAKLSLRDWTFFLVGFLAWTADAFDFHALSIQTVKLSKYFHTSKTNITSAITLTLLLRSVGALFFGLLGDRFGRKWPMVFNMITLGALQIATIYCRSFGEFLGVRSLFGLFMGGVYGNAVAMALEHCAVETRGVMSGILQQGYSFGYVLAACTNLGVGGSTNSWKKVFWVGAALSFGVGLIRCVFPESRQFLEAKKARKEGKQVAAGTKVFFRNTAEMLKTDWRMAVYCIILLTWFNFYSHSSQDSYTTFVLTQKGLNNSAASRASIWMKAGACVGGMIIGYFSQFLGRRRTIVLSALMSCFMIPAWILPEGERQLSVSGFFMQFFVQGAWGVIPIHLNELSPPAFRSTFPGLTYQIGNMISSPAAQIVNAIAEHKPMHYRKKLVPAYGPTMGIVTAIIVLLIILTTVVGPERRGRHFEDALPAGVVLEEREVDAEKGDVIKSDGKTGATTPVPVDSEEAKQKTMAVETLGTVQHEK